MRARRNQIHTVWMRVVLAMLLASSITRACPTSSLFASSSSIRTCVSRASLFSHRALSLHSRSSRMPHAYIPHPSSILPSPFSLPHPPISFYPLFTPFAHSYLFLLPSSLSPYFSFIFTRSFTFHTLWKYHSLLIQYTHLPSLQYSPPGANN